MSNMTTDHTAPALLDAVGVDWRADPSLSKDVTGAWCIGLRPLGADIYSGVFRYTGPALGTPELDGVLFAAGVKRLRDASRDRLFTILSKLPDHEFHNAALTLLLHDLPGHALARAIREVSHA